MKTWIIAAMIAAQVAALAWMAGEREWIVRHGQRVLLRTAPLDPNDPMRGRYVRLDYSFGRIPKRACRDGVLAWFKDSRIHPSHKDRVVYAVFKPGFDGLAEFDHLTDRKPTSGLFLKGRVNQLGADQVIARFGIEALFMQQDQAMVLETTAAQRRGVGIPLNVKIAVSPGGTAVLLGYDWEPLGLAVTIERERREVMQAGRSQNAEVATAVVVTVQNHGATPLTLHLAPNGASFRLVPTNRWGSEPDNWEAVMPQKDTPDRVQARILQPGEVLEERLSIAQLAATVRRVAPVGEGTPSATPEAALVADALSWFRIEYVPPHSATEAGIGVWRRSLPSRAFTLRGGVD